MVSSQNRRNCFLRWIPISSETPVNTFYIYSMHDHDHNHHDEHYHHHDHRQDGHGHTHGLVDESILRSRAGVRVVSLSLAVLLVTSSAQVVLFLSTNSISLLADVIHNFGDALTALPLAAAFTLRNKTAEKYAGYVVVATIFLSAFAAAIEALSRFAHPQAVAHLYTLVAAGIIGFAGNEMAAVIRLRAGKTLHSAALIADGNHAKVDGFVSLSVVTAAILVALGFQIADPIIGLIITVVILRITWQSYATIRSS